MNVGVNYMREHMPSTRGALRLSRRRRHRAERGAGHGEGPLPDPRANLTELNALIARVRKIADGAALMTETTVATALSPPSPTCSATRRWNARWRRT
jgi:aminobenzoyl-glutamate utilization protein B